MAVFHNKRVFTKRNFRRRIVAAKHFPFVWSFSEFTRALCFINRCVKLHSLQNSFNLKEFKATIRKIAIGTCRHISVFVVLRQVVPHTRWCGDLRNGVFGIESNSVYNKPLEEGLYKTSRNKYESQNYENVQTLSYAYMQHLEIIFGIQLAT